MSMKAYLVILMLAAFFSLIIQIFLNRYFKKEGKKKQLLILRVKFQIKAKS